MELSFCFRLRRFFSTLGMNASSHNISKNPKQIIIRLKDKTPLYVLFQSVVQIS